MVQTKSVLHRAIDIQHGSRIGSLIPFKLRAMAFVLSADSTPIGKNPYTTLSDYLVLPYKPTSGSKCKSVILKALTLTQKCAY